MITVPGPPSRPKSKQFSAATAALLEESVERLYTVKKPHLKREKKSKKTSSKRKNAQIVVNLDHCMYPLVAQCVRREGWRIAKKGEAWDMAISDNNAAVKMLVKMTSHPRTLCPVKID